MQLQSKRDPPFPNTSRRLFVSEHNSSVCSILVFYFNLSSLGPSPSGARTHKSLAPPPVSVAVSLPPPLLRRRHRHTRTLEATNSIVAATNAQEDNHGAPLVTSRQPRKRRVHHQAILHGKGRRGRRGCQSGGAGCRAGVHATHARKRNRKRKPPCTRIIISQVHVVTDFKSKSDRMRRIKHIT